MTEFKQRDSVIKLRNVFIEIAMVGMAGQEWVVLLSDTILNTK